jgi:hypothetical protein
MSFQKALLISFGLGSLCGAAGCSSTSGTTPDGSGGGSGQAGCDNIDYASYKTGAPVSFKTDVMPIFGLSCAYSQCHNSKDKKAGLDLGWRCAPVAATQTCEFPATEDPNSMASSPLKPLTPDVLAAVYKSLMDPATTVTSPSVPRVIKNDPEHSFLIEKVADTQDRPTYTCKNQDPSHETNPQPCGALMPLNAEPLCAGTGRARFDLLARWIAQGAPGDN